MAKKEDKGDGHNALNLDKLPDFITDLLKAHDVMESDNASNRTKIKGIYDKAASTTGMTKRLLQREFKRARSKQKERAEELEFSETERLEIEAFRERMKGTPMGKFFEDKLAKTIN